MVSVQTSFYFNLKLQAGVIYGQRASESMLQKVALSVFQDIFFHSCGILVLLFTVHAAQATFGKYFQSKFKAFMVSLWHKEATFLSRFVPHIKKKIETINNEKKL